MSRRLLTAILFVALFAFQAPARGAQSAASEIALTQAAARVFKEAYPNATISISGPLELHAVGGPGIDLKIRLDKVWRACTDDPTSCDASLAEYVRRSAAAFSPAAPPTPDQIVPALRPKSYLDEVADAKTVMAVEPFAGDLMIVYMLDMPDQARILHRAELTALGIADLAKVTRANLALRLPDVTQTIQTAPTNTAIPLVKGNYWESSRLLQKDLWKLAATRGPVFVAVPERDSLVFIIAPTPDVLAKFVAVAHAIYQGGKQPLSPSVFRWTDAGWVEQRSP